MIKTTASCQNKRCAQSEVLLVFGHEAQLRRFLLAVFGERQLRAKDLNSGEEFFQTRDQRHPIDGGDRVILHHVEYDLAGHKVLSIAIRHDGDDRVAHWTPRISRANTEPTLTTCVTYYRIKA
jgi:hypothetical protein